MRTYDLTRGPIARPMVSIAFPLLMGSLLQQFYNAVDAFIIGRYVGQAAFAAIGVAGTVMNLFIFILSGCCTGISVVLAQLYGSKDNAQFRNAGFLSTVFGGGFTVLLSLLGVVILPALLRLMQTPQEVYVYSIEYLRIIFIGLLCTFFYNYGAAVLRAVGNTRAALYILAIAMMANLALDYLFVAVFHWSIAGAAWATILAQLLSAVCCQIYMRHTLADLQFGQQDMYFNGSLLSRILRYGAEAALHQSSLYIGKLLVQAAVNTTGTVGISAYTAATRLEGFINSFGDCGGQAVSLFVAQNAGAGNFKRMRQCLRTGLKFMISLSFVLALILGLTANWAVPFLMGEADAATIAGAVEYLRIVLAFYLISFQGCTFVGYFRGRGKGHLPVMGTTLHISIRVIFSYLLIPTMGLKAVAIGTCIGWMCVYVFHITNYFRIKKQDVLAGNLS